MSLWVAGIILGLLFLGGWFYGDVEDFGEDLGGAMALLAFPVAFFGMLLGLVGLMFGTGLRLAQSLASPDMEDV